MRGLSKSRFLEGLQCEKRLYFSAHKLHADLLERERAGGSRLRIAQGHEVGVLARTKFPGGVLIDAPPSKTQQALIDTEEALRGGAPAIFEATFAHQGRYARVDILQRLSGGAWDLIEVKSTTEVKDEHLWDVAFQLEVCERAGLEIREAYVMHLNREATAQDPQDLDQLFLKASVTTQARALLGEVEAKASAMAAHLDRDTAPPREIGPHCSAPYSCPCQEVCWEHLPTPSIFDVPGLGPLAWQLYAEGTRAPREINLERVNEHKRRIVESLASGVPWIDREALSEAMRAWVFPLHFLDFETIGLAIPRFESTKPYQQVPFQWSCHIVHRREDFSAPEHSEFVATDAKDPRIALTDALRSALGPTGSIVAYNQSFEIRVLRELATFLPQKEPWITSLIPRFVDPLPILKRSTYHPAFGNSYSIKSVAPAILGDSFSYERLRVGDGSAAQEAYLDLIAPDTSPNKSDVERHALLAGLKEYCRQDTLAMVELVRWMFDRTVA